MIDHLARLCIRALPRLTFICAVVFLLVGARLQAEEDVDTAMARLADGGMQTGSLLSISEDSIRLSDHRVALANVVRLDFQGRAVRFPGARR